MLNVLLQGIIDPHWVGNKIKTCQIVLVLQNSDLVMHFKIYFDETIQWA